GTSMSAPLVSAAGALLMSVRPNLTNDEVETILEETAHDVGLPQIEAGAGLLDVEAAVRRILDGKAVITPASIGAMVLPGALSFTQTVIVDNPSLAPVDVAGAIPLANWYDVINVQGGGFVASLVHGEPLYLTIVMSPTNLITGVYTNEIVLDLTYAYGKKGVTSLPLLLGVGELPTQTYLPLIANRSSQPLPPSPLPFAWETPVVTPTVLSIGSGGSVKVSLPFAFPLSGVDITSSESYTEMQVYEDGFLVFADSSFVPVPEPSQNQCLPVLDQPAQAIFGWWADLNASLPGGEIMTFQPAPDRFVIQYENIASAAGVTPSYTATFQIVLHANGNVGLNYLDVPDAIAQALDELTPEVTVGVQAKSGLFHNQVTCITLTDGYGRPPHSETSILIKREDVY
ncbi:MAG: S8 family serine peptidase, partial [Caldilinea sp.]